MPPGTDRKSVTEAAREFAHENFSNHQYVFATHEDEKHPHVHLCIKAVDFDGVRLNPRKADLQHYREQFAEKMREQGIEANATPRKSRGIVRKAGKSAIINIDREFEEGKREEPSRITQLEVEDAKKEIQTGQKKLNPAENKIEANRKEIIQGYGELAKELVKSNDVGDRELALQIIQHMKGMPPLETKREQLVSEMKKETQAHQQDSSVKHEREAEGKTEQKPEPKRSDERNMDR